MEGCLGSALGLLRARLLGDCVALGAARLTGLGLHPALGLEVLLRLHGEGEVLGADLAVDEHGLHALVCHRAVMAALGLLPALLFKDTGLGVREEEGGLAVAARQVRARRLGLLGLTALGAVQGRLPVLLLEEELILAREGEATAALAARQLQVIRQRSTLLLRVARSAAPCGLVALLGLGLALRSRLGLGLCDLLLIARNALRDALEHLMKTGRVLAVGNPPLNVAGVRLGLEEELVSDERHLMFVRRLGKGTVPSRSSLFNFTFVRNAQKKIFFILSFLFLFLFSFGLVHSDGIHIDLLFLSFWLVIMVKEIIVCSIRLCHQGRMEALGSAQLLDCLLVTRAQDLIGHTTSRLIFTHNHNVTDLDDDDLAWDVRPDLHRPPRRICCLDLEPAVAERLDCAANESCWVFQERLVAIVVLGNG